MITAEIAKKLVNDPDAGVRHVKLQDTLGRAVTAKVLGYLIPWTPRKDDYFCLVVRRESYAPFYIDQSNAEDWEPIFKEP